MRQALRVKTTHYKKHPVEVYKALHVLNPYYGIKPQYQRAEVPPGGDCETVDPTVDTGYFYEQTSGQLDVAVNGAGRVGTNCARLTQTAHTTATAVYLRFANAAGVRSPIDLRWARYVGMWIRGGAGDVFDPADMHVYLFTKEGDFLYADRSIAIDMFYATYTDPGGAIWSYVELELDRFTVNVGHESDNLSEVFGIGWYSDDVTVGNTLDIDQIEFYTHGTGYGPARGNIISAPLRHDAALHLTKGYPVAWAETAGRVDLAGNDETAFCGICVDNPSETRLAIDYTDPATEITVLDASLFEIGSAWIWDDTIPAGETVTITAVNRVTNTLTVTAIGNDYTIADDAKIAMQGTPSGSIRVDIVIDGIVNMFCGDGSIANVGDGVSLEIGGVPTLWTDPAIYHSTQDTMIGKATEVGTDGEIIPVILGAVGPTV